MSCATVIVPASAHSARRAAEDISGRAPPAAVAPPAGRASFCLLVVRADLDPGLGGVSVGVGEQLLLAPGAGFGDDVLERFHLLRHHPTPLLDHAHPGNSRLDDQRAADFGEE